MHSCGAARGFVLVVHLVKQPVNNVEHQLPLRGYPMGAGVGDGGVCTDDKLNEQTFCGPVGEVEAQYIRGGAL